MPIVRAFDRAAAVLAIALGVAGAAPAAGQPVLNAMTAIRPGRWQLRVAGEAPRALCVADADAEALFQIRHRAAACGRLVIADARTMATVHYSCPGAGWGRTTLHVSSPSAVRISTQGIADNAPFDFEARAVRLGDCPARSASR